MRARDKVALASDLGICFIAFFGLIMPELVGTIIVNVSLLGLFLWGVITLKDTTAKTFERICGQYVSFAVIATLGVYYLISGPVEGIKLTLFFVLIMSAIYISFGFAAVRAHKYISKIEEENRNNN